MWLRKKDKQELETKIDDLRSSIKVLKSELVKAKVVQGYYKPHDWHPHRDLEPISLIGLKNQIESIKDFLGIKYVTKPEIPAESMMEEIPSTDDD